MSKQRRLYGENRRMVRLNLLRDDMKLWTELGLGYEFTYDKQKHLILGNYKYYSGGLKQDQISLNDELLRKPGNSI